MFKKFLESKYLILFVLVSFVVGIFSSNFIFADDSYTTLVIEENGVTTCGAIFNSHEPWAPGYSQSNVLRLENSLGRKININKLGMNINLIKNNEPLNFEDNRVVDFLNNFKMKIEYKNPIKDFIEGTIFDGSFNEFLNGANTSIGISNGDSIDLKYTVTMHKDAGISVAGITANFDFTVSISELESNDKGKKTPHTISVYRESETEFVESPAPPALEEEHWSHDCIETLVEVGIVEGYDDGSIKPERKITRAEAAELIAKAIGVNPSNFSSKLYYIDEIPDWAEGYVVALTRKGILDGYDDKKFKPSRPITREEMTKALVIAFELELGGDFELQFKDKDEISDWAYDYVVAGVENGAIEGYPDNTFRPGKWITRAESFTLICKLTGLHETHKIKVEEE